MFENLRAKGFEVELLAHAEAILATDFPDAVHELETVLDAVEVPITEIIGSGGGETQGTQRMRRGLADLGWRKVCFTIEKRINGTPRESIPHDVDHVKTSPNGHVVALELESNNKDPFFDRDLENFKRLHAEGAISVGVIVTRGSTLQDQMRDFVYRFTQDRGIVSYAELEALGWTPTPKQRAAVMKRVTRAKDPIDFATAWTDKFVADKYGAATTHWRKLQDRVRRGVGNPCPLLLIGLPASIVSFDPDARIDAEDEDEAADDPA